MDTDRNGRKIVKMNRERRSRDMVLGSLVGVLVSLLSAVAGYLVAALFPPSDFRAYLDAVRKYDAVVVERDDLKVAMAGRTAELESQLASKTAEVSDLQYIRPGYQQLSVFTFERSEGSTSSFGNTTVSLAGFDGEPGAQTAVFNLIGFQIFRFGSSSFGSGRFASPVDAVRSGGVIPISVPVPLEEGGRVRICTQETDIELVITDDSVNAIRAVVAFYPGSREEAEYVVGCQAP